MTLAMCQFTSPHPCSHVSRAQAIHCKRKRPLCMHPPVPAVPSRAVWRPHLSLCSPDTSSTTLSFRTLAGRRRWRERGGPGYSTRSEKAPACHLQRAAHQRAAHRQNEGKGGPHWQGLKSGDLLVPYHPLSINNIWYLSTRSRRTRTHLSVADEPLL